MNSKYYSNISAGNYYTSHIAKQPNSSPYKESFNHKNEVDLSESFSELFIKKKDPDIIENNIMHELVEYKPLTFLSKKAHGDLAGDPENERKGRKTIVEEGIEKINSLKNKAKEIELNDYTRTFEDTTRDYIAIFGEVDVDQLSQEGAKALRTESVDIKLREDMKNILQVKEDCKDELYHKKSLYQKNIDRIEETSAEYAAEKLKSIKNTFRNTENQINIKLKTIKKIIRSDYKELYIEEYQKFYKHINLKTQLVVDLRLELVRCVKDKIPKGQYVILCSVLDRIDGNVIRYKNGKKCRKISTSRLHNGQYHLNNIRFEESIRIKIPSLSNLAPSMVYLFELCLLRSKEFTYDQVLGWGVFPLIDSNFKVITGKYKVPLLFGPVNPAIEKYKDIQNSYMQKLDNWLCNLYFSLKFKEKEEKFTIPQEPRTESIFHNKDTHTDKEDIKKEEKLLKANDFDQYTFTVSYIPSKTDTVITRKFRYIMNEVISDLGFNNILSIDFWISFIILISVLWARSFVHTFGSWLFLKCTGTNVDELSPTLYFMITK